MKSTNHCVSHTSYPGNLSYLDLPTRPRFTGSGYSTLALKPIEITDEFAYAPAQTKC